MMGDSHDDQLDDEQPIVVSGAPEVSGLIPPVQIGRENL
jgi:hypothetical protein